MSVEFSSIRMENQETKFEQMDQEPVSLKVNLLPPGGIIAGDLDSLLEMFEEAASNLSSCVGCISLNKNVTPTDSDADASLCLSSGSLLSKEESGNAVVRNSFCSTNSAENLTLIYNGATIATSDDACHDARCFEASQAVSFSVAATPSDLSVDASFSVTRGGVDEGKTEGGTFHGNTVSSISVASTDDDFADLRSLMSPEIDLAMTLLEYGDDTAQNSDAGTTSHPEDDSETSVDTDDSPSDDCSDNSESPRSQARSCGGASTFRINGPRRQQGRGRVRSKDEEKLYDRLPSYYTVFSRPNRTASGLVRSSRSCLKKMISSSVGVPGHDRDPSPDRDSAVFDKVPAYQSIFTNSTRYDSKAEETTYDLEGLGGRDEDDAARFSHGRATASNGSDARQRYRSRSRLRAGTRHRVLRRIGARDAATVSQASAGNCAGSETSEPVCETILQEELGTKTKQKERCILYVGNIPATLTAEQLKSAFERFGKIEKCTVHLRECRDNYGFVTYAETIDAYAAVEKGNRIPGCEKFDICFGGRRIFCRADYLDLDGNVEMQEEFAPILKSKCNFDDLLSDAMSKRKLQ